MQDVDVVAQQKIYPHRAVRGTQAILEEGLNAALKDTGVRWKSVRCLDNLLEEERTLGCGSFGSVTQRRWLPDCAPSTSGGKETAAVKELERDAFMSSRRALSRILFEVAACASFNHPNIVRLQAVFLDSEMLYLVMDLCEGRVLSKCVGEGGLAKRVARELGSALKYLHDNGVLHRDVKPENVVFGPEGVKLLDFSFAKYVGQAVGDTVPSTPSCLTLRAAPFEAVVRYAAFADRRAATVDVPPSQLAKQDVYGMGLCILTLLAPPATRSHEGLLFNAKGGIDDIAKAKKEKPGFVEGDWEENGGQVPRLARDWVACTMDPDPDCRWSVNDALEHPWLCDRPVLGPVPVR